MCPGAGDEAMGKIAEIVGLTAAASKPMGVAVLRCNGHVRIDLQLQITTGPNRVLS